MSRPSDISPAELMRQRIGRLGLHFPRRAKLAEVGYCRTRFEAALMASHLSAHRFRPRVVFEVEGANPYANYGGYSVRVPADQAEAASDHLRKLEERALLMRQADPIPPGWAARADDWISWVLFVLIFGGFGYVALRLLWSQFSGS